MRAPTAHAALQFTIGRHHHDLPIMLSGNDVDDCVVSGAGRGDHPHVGTRLDTARLSLDHQHHVERSGYPGQSGHRQGCESVAEAQRRAASVAPPAVGHRTDDIGGVDHQCRRLRCSRSRHHPIVPGAPELAQVPRRVGQDSTTPWQNRLRGSSFAFKAASRRR